MGTIAEAEEERQQHWEGAAANLSVDAPFWKSFRSRLRETFFPDDPFRRRKRGAWGVVSYFVPILEWAPRYRLSHLWSDLLAGITITSLAIPQGISYAKLAGVPPIVGLYSSFVPPLVYSVFGSSNCLAVGNVAAASLLLASIIGGRVSEEEEPEVYLGTVFTAALFTGLFQLAFGIFRLGILVDFLSRSTITGFMGGTAMIIILQQLKGLLGLQHFTTKTDIVSVVHSVFANRHEWKWQSAVLGLGFLIILLLARRLKEKIPKLFWVNAITPLLVVVMGGIIAFSANGKDHGIPIEGIAVGRSLAILKNEQTDGNKEMIAFGMMNIVGSLTSCYLTTGPFSKSAVNYNAGCRSPMANVVMGICMMLVLLFLTPLFKYTPLVALAAIIVVAMLGLIEPHEMRHLFNVDKFDFCVCMAALLGVVFINMEVGLLLSVGLSIIRALLHVSRPISCKLGKVPGTQLYRDVEQYADSTAIPGILILQMGSPIYFANANYLKERSVCH